MDSLQHTKTSSSSEAIDRSQRKFGVGTIECGEKVARTEAIHIKMFIMNSKGIVSEIRRINAAPTLTFQQLKDAIAAELDCDFAMEYKDPDGDMVMLGSDSEWEECLTLQSYNCGALALRLHVKKIKSKKEKEDKESKQAGKAHAPSEEPPSSDAGSSFDRSSMTLEPNLCYMSGNGPMPDAAKLQELQVKALPILSRLLPPNWSGVHFDCSMLPEWCRPAFKSSMGAGHVDLDIDMQRFAECLNSHGIAVMDQKNYADALQLFEDSYALMPGGGSVYNQACCFALMNEPDAAVERLNAAVQQGYRNLNHLQKDPDLESLHGHEGFRAIVNQLEEILSDDLYEVVNPDASVNSNALDQAVPSSSVSEAPPAEPPVEDQPLVQEPAPAEVQAPAQTGEQTASNPSAAVIEPVVAPDEPAAEPQAVPVPEPAAEPQPEQPAQPNAQARVQGLDLNPLLRNIIAAVSGGIHRQQRCPHNPCPAAPVQISTDPVVEPPQYVEQRRKLIDMGFLNDEVNLKLLGDCDGVVTNVIDRLLSMGF